MTVRSNLLQWKGAAAGRGQSRTTGPAAGTVRTDRHRKASGSCEEARRTRLNFQDLRSRLSRLG